MKTFKTEFKPDLNTEIYIRKACGIRRWTWNWAVAKYFEEAKNDKFLTSYDLQKILNHGPVEDENYSWLTEVNSMVRGEALKDFGLSIAAYVKARKRSKRTVEKIPVDKYKPSFKKKGKCTESFRIFKKGGSEFKIHSAHKFSMVTTRGNKRLVIKPLESIEFLKDADILTCTISMKANKFFMSITYEKANQGNKQSKNLKAGIDLGIKHLGTLFDGQNSRFLELPKSLFKAEKRTEHLNQLLAKTEKGSKRHSKALLRVQRAYLKESNIKKDFREKLTTELVSSYNQINIDDFGFEGAKNLDKNRALYRVGCYLFKLRLQQKAATFGCTVNFIPKFTPTTQTCSSCGHKHSMKIEDRTYICKNCGLSIDRDVNSAINVYNYF